MRKYVRIIFNPFLHLILRISCIIYNHPRILAGIILETNLFNLRYALSVIQSMPKQYNLYSTVLYYFCNSATYLSVYLSVGLSIYLFIYLSIYLSFYPSTYLAKGSWYINYRIKQDSSFDRPVLKNQHTFKELDESF